MTHQILVVGDIHNSQEHHRIVEEVRRATLDYPDSQILVVGGMMTLHERSFDLDFNNLPEIKMFDIQLPKAPAHYRMNFKTGKPLRY